MIEIFSSDACRDMDNTTIECIGIPNIVLMENAAIAIYNEILNKGEKFLLLCGKGNNGGDGLAIARHLAIAGKEIKIYVISKNENYTDCFKTNMNILSNILSNDKIQYIRSEEDINEEFINDLKTFDIVVDSIFGVGLNRKLDNMFKTVIEKINDNSNFVASIDIPSGLNSDVGIEMGKAVKADITYTLEVLKRGLLNYNSINYVGKLKILEIGIPPQVKRKNSDKLYMLEEKDYMSIIPERKVYGHKGNYGRAIIMAGSSKCVGAAFITTECTIRSGAGLTTLLCSQDVRQLLSTKLIEAMTEVFGNENSIEIIKNADSIAFGPGIGLEEEKGELLKQVINNSNCKIVIDADGIILLGKNKDLINKLKGRGIITPHPGEMAKILGITIKEVENDRINIARNVAKKYGIIVLLKGYNTVISDGENTYINPTGNSKMASGGMGDALTGIINAFLSQGCKCIEAALLGAYIHGKIADILAKESYIVNARDIVEMLPSEINNIIKNK